MGLSLFFIQIFLVGSVKCTFSAKMGIGRSRSSMILVQIESMYVTSY